MIRWIGPRGLLVACGALAAAAAAQAEPLSKEACAAVEAEHAKLAAAGMPELVKKGPAWAKANLGAAQIKDVARYIELEGDLLFRCGHDKLRRGIDPAADGAEAAAPPPRPQRKPGGGTAAKRQEAGQPAADGKAAAQPKPKPKPKPTPKPKAQVDDAYRPPQQAPASQ
jgi:hypothetical protein